MFEQRSEEAELMDDLYLSNEALRKNLEELAFINKWLGGNAVVTDALHTIIQKYPSKNQALNIADLGCGGGDILRQVANWARKKQQPISLTGIDANAFMVQYSRQQCAAYNNIKVLQENIFAPAFKQKQFDIIICSLFCHHFTTQELISLFSQLQQQAHLAVIINDIHRHPLAYYSIKWLTQVFSGSYLVKNDAPLSVLRAFRKSEIQHILGAAGITNFSLQWQWAFRWRLIIYKNL
ncbi:MAG: SAM-dependent methyltransferase [Cytophagales bacterium CG18_big_fil_WC_8_21_14_2_50_42_9]|nr:MAG: SAM-dependent methyltransferase [Cytophagales bacterium CG18_big_fil_WC_8_21_14_2_50_42_9]